MRATHAHAAVHAPALHLAWLVLVAGAAAPCAAQPPPADPVTSAALALAAAAGARPPQSTLPVAPGASAADDAAQQMRDYASVWGWALKNPGEPVLVYVGFSGEPPSYEVGAWCRWDAFTAFDRDVRPPCVVVAMVPAAGDTFHRVEVLPGRPTLAQVRAALARHRAAHAAPTTAPAASVPQPAPWPLPRAYGAPWGGWGPAFGGFGGFGGGGQVCGPGGCPPSR